MNSFQILGILLILTILVKAQNDLIKIREWKKLDFKFPSPTARSEALSSKKWVPENAFPIDMDVDYTVSLDQSRIFVTIPRFSDGVPITLGYLSSNPSDLQINPYPDYSWHSHQGTNCDRIISAIRIAIDECRQLWVLDTGKVGDVQKCPPQIFIFNLRSNTLVRNYKFPSSQYVADSLFINPIVDVKNCFDNCKNTKVYIADVTGFALIVYDFATNKSWKIKNSLFNPETAYSRYSLAGETFDLPDGLFGLAVSPKTYYQRYLFFHALASDKENYVPLNLIDNPNIWTANQNAEAVSFRTLGYRRIQSPAEAMDQYGNLYFVLLKPIALACWDSSTPYNRDNIQIIYQNDQTLQFASGLKVIKNLNQEEEIWITTIRFQKIANGNLNFNEVNFRIQSRNINALLKGRTKCNGIPLSYF